MFVSPDRDILELSLVSPLIVRTTVLTFIFQKVANIYIYSYIDIELFDLQNMRHGVIRITIEIV